MSTELETNSATKSSSLTEDDNEHNSDSYEQGEWELAGAKNKKTTTQQQKTIRTRRARINSRSNTTKASKTQSTSNKTEPANNQATNDTASKQSASESPSVEAPPLPVASTPVAATILVTNPWAKLPAVKAVPIDAQFEMHSLPVIQDNATSNSLNHVPNTLKTSASFSNNSHLKVDAANAAANLDSNDWPTLSTEELGNFTSLNCSSSQSNTNKVSYLIINHFFRLLKSYILSHSFYLNLFAIFWFILDFKFRSMFLDLFRVQRHNVLDFSKLYIYTIISFS
jgi:hypothetical protein